MSNTAPAPEAHPVPADPWPIPPAVQAARKMVFEIRSRLESNLNAIENYAKMLTIASTSDGVTELHGFAISQISRDISERVETIWDGDIADLMNMLRPELQNYWKFGVIENEDGDDDDGNGDVEESVGASKLARLIEADKAAMAAFRVACTEAEASRDRPSTAWSTKLSAENASLMAVCRYDCHSLEEVRTRAEYLLSVRDWELRLQPEHIESLLRSSSAAAAQ